MRGARVEVQLAFLALGPAIGIGIARFSYALILPSMQSDIGWSHAEAGWINTANAAGYLIGALTASNYIAATSLRHSYAVGIILAVLSVLVTGLTASLSVLTAIRLVAGLAGALIFVAAGTIAADIASRYPEKGALLIGLLYAGPGFGIALSGALIPSFLEAFGAQSWRLAWPLLAIMAALLGVVSIAFLRNTSISTEWTSRHRHDEFSLYRHSVILISYAFFGLGSIGYMTFMFAALRDQGMGIIELSSFWVVLGVSAMASPWLWKRLIAEARDARAYVTLLVITLAGACIPLLVTGVVAAILSAAVFGAAFFAVVTATTAYVRLHCGPAGYASAIGYFTAAFGVGQIVGPVGLGFIGDRYSGIEAGLAVGCLCLMASILLGLTQVKFQSGL